MKLHSGQLARHLGDAPHHLYAVHGDEPLLVLEAADAIRAAARRHGFDEREVLVVGPGFSWDALAAATLELSLFGGRKLIDLRIPGGKPGRDGGDALQHHARNRADGTMTLITLPQLDWQVRKSAWLRALDDAGVIVECNAPERERLPSWIATRLAAQKQSAPDEALEFIAMHVEGNLLAAHQEILKLGLLYPQGELRTGDIRDAVLNVARYDLDRLREALVDGDAGRCVRLLDGLEAEGVAPPLVLWALASELRTLATLRAGLDAGRPLAALLRAERVFDERRRLAIGRALPRVSLAALRTAMRHAARIDRVIKGIAGGDAWDEFLSLALRVNRFRSR